MSFNQLCEAQLYIIFQFLNFQHIKSLFFLNKAFNHFLIHYLQKYSYSIHKYSLIKLNQYHIKKLLKICKSYHRFQLPYINARLSNIYDKISNKIKILKLSWVPQKDIYQKSFWKTISTFKQSLEQLSISTYRKIQKIDRAKLEYQQIGYINMQQMKNFFDGLKKLVKFSLKFQMTRNKQEKLNQNDYIKYFIQFQSFIFLGLVNSQTTIQTLKMTNLILKIINIPQAKQIKSLKKVKIIFSEDLPHKILNQLQLSGYQGFRLVGQTLILLINFFPCLSSIEISDYSNNDDKFLNQNSLIQLKNLLIENKQSIQLILSSSLWHWNMSKIDLFQFCQFPLKNRMKLRSLFAFDGDSMNILRMSNQRQFLNLLILDLSYTNIDDFCLKIIEEQFSKIEQLSINGCKKLSKNGLIQLFSKLQNLKRVSVEQLHGFTNSVLNTLIQKNELSLQQITLKKNKINYEMIQFLFKKCKKLSCVKLKNMNKIYDDFSFLWITKLAQNNIINYQLNQLDLNFNSNLSIKELIKISYIFPNLKTLKIMETFYFTQQLIDYCRIHPTVKYLSAYSELDVSLRKFKKYYLRWFPNMLILGTQLSQRLREQIEERDLKYTQNLLIYDDYYVLKKI